MSTPLLYSMSIGATRDKTPEIQLCWNQALKMHYSKSFSIIIYDQFYIHWNTIKFLYETWNNREKTIGFAFLMASEMDISTRLLIMSLFLLFDLCVFVFISSSDSLYLNFNRNYTIVFAFCPHAVNRVNWAIHLERLSCFDSLYSMISDPIERN